MSEDRVPAVVESLIRVVAGGSGEDREERASTFARGLALGALVGAAIAGSTIWQRKVAREHARAAALEAEHDAVVPHLAAEHDAVVPHLAAERDTEAPAVDPERESPQA
jgi:hypothetical protein